MRVRSGTGGWCNVTCDNSGEPFSEYLQHCRLGVDGVLSDVGDTALQAHAI